MRQYQGDPANGSFINPVYVMMGEPEPIISLINLGPKGKLHCGTPRQVGFTRIRKRQEKRENMVTTNHERDRENFRVEWGFDLRSYQSLKVTLYGDLQCICVYRHDPTQ